MIKFREMDDIKNTTRDTIAYLKYYTPLNAQMLINENIQQMLKN